MRPITLSWLKAKEACAEHLVIFESHFGSECEVTATNLRKAAELALDLDWVAKRRLKGEKLREYQEKLAPLYREYREKRAPLYREYEEKRAPLDREYEEKRAPLDREYQEKLAELLICQLQLNEERP